MKTVNEMDFDWTRNLPRTDDIERFAAAVEEIIAPENYGVRWCATQFADRDALPVHAQAVAENILTGYDVQERRENQDRAIARHITVTLEVLTRQACERDKNGKKIEGATIEDKPQDGDVVVMNIGKRRGVGGRALTEQDYSRLRSQGLTDSITKDHVIRSGCIEVPYFLAVGLLADYGFRCAKPQFYTIAPSKRDISMAIATGDKPRERHIANWLYREVFDVGAASGHGSEPIAETQERKIARR